VSWGDQSWTDVASGVHGVALRAQVMEVDLEKGRHELTPEQVLEHVRAIRQSLDFIESAASWDLPCD
jgi:hypothetical protein